MTGDLAGMVDGASIARRRTADDDQYPVPPAPPPGGQVTVFLVNGTRTSAGCGPGPLTLPAAEAGRLVAARLAVYGDRPPRNFADGGQPGPVTAVREFR